MLEGVLKMELVVMYLEVDLLVVGESHNCGLERDES